MKYQSLYRKYRPKNFNELYGQNVAKKIILNSLKNDKLSHAYLFYGPRGTGKTSIAKMFARVCNCTNIKNGNCCEICENCIESAQEMCVDIIEIDAASNNGVDEIRELKNKINLVPNKLKYKVYIIDEVHMLSIGAFNALLKTLEEPPEYVIFILATTEFYKVPETIVSRCQTIEFRPIDIQNINNRLSEICKLEKINIADDAINEISIHSNGGLRDAIGLLQKVSSYSDDNKKIDKKSVQECMGIISDVEIEQIFLCINDENSDIRSSLKKLDEGKDFYKITEQLLYYYRNKIVNDSKCELLDDIKMIFGYLEKMKKVINKKILFEMMLLELNKKANNCSLKNDDTLTENVMNDFALKTDSNQYKIKIDNNLAKIRINNTFSTANKTMLNKIKKDWDIFKNNAFDLNVGALCCDLADTEPVVCGEKNLIIAAKYSSVLSKINSNIILYENLISQKLKIDIKLFAVDFSEWENLKKEYIENLKKGYKYTYFDENAENIVNSDVKNVNINEEDIFEKAKELFGNVE